MKILQCARCGAPLEAKLFSRRIKCNYCGATNEEEKLETLHAEKPKDFSKPKKWTPPESAPIESREPLPYRRDLGDWFAIIYVPALVLIFAGAAAWDAWGGKVYGVVPADLARFDAAGSPQAVGKQLQGAHVEQKTVTANFRTGSAGPFKSLRFDWSASSLAAPEFIVLGTTDSKATAPADVEARLSADLPGGLDAQGTWKFGAVYVQYRKELGGGIDVTVDPHPDSGDNPLAARQVSVAMHVIANAAFNLPLGVDANEMRDVFGGGYPVKNLLELDPKTTVANAPNAMKALFPGASVEAHSFHVHFDHPLISGAILQWDDPDEHDGRMRSIRFDVTRAYHARRESFVACLEKTLGPPKKSATKNAVDYRFALAVFPAEADLALLADDTTVMDAFDRFPADKWRDVFTSIDACR